MKKPIYKVYKPNHIPVSERIWSVILSLVLVIYGTIGLYLNDIYIPGKHGPGIHFHDFPLWFMYLAFLTAAANLLAVVFDHYDKRDNEINYKKFAKITRIAGWIFFGVAMALHVIYTLGPHKH